MKTLNDCKQEIAKKHGYKTWVFTSTIPKIFSDEAAELYAEYRYKEGLEGYQTARFEAKEEGYKQGWNKALQWASEQIKEPMKKYFSYSTLKQSILNGLKKENE